ncbi:MAG: hypothetical protein ACI8QC_002157 [Planctomycetota bacterium]|jgi:hypothetical protein
MRLYQAIVLSLFSCAVPLGAQSDSGAQQPAQTPAQSFEPIRFGDLPEHVYAGQLLPGREYDASLPTPDALLGESWGSRIASHAEILGALSKWAELSPRASMQSYGRTHEGRELVVLVITSEANQARIGEIQGGLAQLYNPVGLSEDEGAGLVAELPACAWMGYSIHGDETSGSDAAPLLAYHLMACRDVEVQALLDDVVIVMDPCLNPDGRERIRSMTHWMSGYRTNLDVSSMQRGRWPYGRGNHYLFDMNRDWMAGICPETRGRWGVLQDWHPQLFVDAHEMGALDTFLFYPQEKPHNTHLWEGLIDWQGRFADAAGAAFDNHGWGYYTREWADAWYPGYSDSWGALNGAVGMLYEQAGIGGQPLLRASGVIETYAESVHGQFVASLSNLETLRATREELLGVYLKGQRASVDDSDGRALVLTGQNTDRIRRLVSTLQAQGLTVLSAEEDFVGSQVLGSDGEVSDAHTFDADESWIVYAAQPGRRMLEAYFDFDPRIDAETLEDERARLERGEGSRLYDVSAWDLARQTGVTAYWCDPQEVSTVQAVLPSSAGRILGEGPDANYAWVVDCSDDASLVFVARALELGLAVHVADRPFAVTRLDAGRLSQLELPRGSFLLRRHENPAGVRDLILRAAQASKVDVVATHTGRAAGATPDLGGQHFSLLRAPRVAMLSGPPCSTSDFGNLWHHLDVDLGIAVTLLEANSLGRYDLRSYDVLIMPPGGMGSVLSASGDAIDTWVRGGGTLIACGSAAGAVAAEHKLTSVRRRRDVLEELDGFDFAAAQQRTAGSGSIDLEALWGTGEPAAPAEDDEQEDATEEQAEGHPDAARQDAYLRRFMPSGAILRSETDPKHWLTAGSTGDLPVLFGGRSALVYDGRAPVRFAEAERLRMAGLVWPEARQRLAGSVWATREGRGHGQVILLATNPVFRGSTRATARIFSNAVLLGAGLGADRVLGR